MGGLGRKDQLVMSGVRRFWCSCHARRGVRISFRDCRNLWLSSGVKAIDEKERSDLRAHLSSFASDGSVTADELATSGCAASLELDAKLAERYLKEMKPGMETAGRACWRFGLARRGHFSAAPPAMESYPAGSGERHSLGGPGSRSLDLGPRSKERLRCARRWRSNPMTGRPVQPWVSGGREDAARGLRLS